jgi:hypothetical protein
MPSLNHATRFSSGHSTKNGHGLARFAKNSFHQAPPLPSKRASSIRSTSSLVYMNWSCICYPIV